MNSARNGSRQTNGLHKAKRWQWNHLRSRPGAQDCGLFNSPCRLRLEKPADLRSPIKAPLLNFQSRRSTPLSVLAADPRPFSPRGRPAQTLPSAHGFRNSQASAEMLACHASCDGHESRQFRPLCGDGLKKISARPEYFWLVFLPWRVLV